MSTSQFLLNLSLNIIGSLIGVVVGVLWSEFQFWRKRCRHQKTVRQGFLDTFSKIDGLVVQVIRQLEETRDKKPNTEGIPNFSLDSLSLVRWIDRADGALPHKVLRDIDGLRYQIEHIENKMQMLYFIAANYGSHTAVAHREFGSVLLHCRKATEWISERKGDVEKAA